MTAQNEITDPRFTAEQLQAMSPEQLHDVYNQHRAAIGQQREILIQKTDKTEE